MRFKAALLLVCLIFTGGCIRVAGNAGYWTQGSEDEAPQGHQAGFDTQRLVPRKE